MKNEEKNIKYLILRCVQLSTCHNSTLQMNTDESVILSHVTLYSLSSERALHTVSSLVFSLILVHCIKPLSRHWLFVKILSVIKHSVIHTMQLVQFSSVPQLYLTLGPNRLQHARLLCPSPIPGAHSNACPSSWWCHSTMSSSVVPFSCLRYFPASGSFPMSQFFESVRCSIGASASVFPMHIQDWSPLGLTCLISLEAKLHLYWVNDTGSGVLNMRMKTFFSSPIPIIYIYFIPDFQFLSCKTGKK